MDSQYPLTVPERLHGGAEELLQIARERDIPLRDDPAFCAALETMDIGRSVPPELFRAVAEVLGFLHGMNAK